MSSTSTPAMTQDCLADMLRLSLVSGVGPRIRMALLEWFGSAAAVFLAATDELRGVQGVGAKLAASITAARQIDVESELALCAEHGISVLPTSHEQYPRLLLEIPDPPGVLFTQGQFQPPDALSIAMVGTRHATQYGKAQAERLAGELARAGLTITSGLARGIDAAAHRGALEAGGRAGHRRIGQRAAVDLSA